MIQRIQTAYLAVGVVLLGATPFLGVRQLNDPTWLYPAVLAVLGLGVLAGVVAIFLYSSRPRQRKVVVFAQLMTLAATMAMAVAGYIWVSGDSLGGIADSSMMLLPPVFAYGMFWLARRAIDKDIALVRSMDRLR